MKKCQICGKTEGRIIKSNGIYYCNRCYQRRGHKIYPLPPYGEIKYNEEGNPICHICGEAHKKLMSHVWQVHGISAYDYKKEFGLDVGKGIMSEESKKKIRNKTLEHKEIVIDKNLLEHGRKSRFKKGHRGRTKEYVSEQTRRMLRQHIKGIGRWKKDNKI